MRRSYRFSGFDKIKSILANKLNVAAETMTSWRDYSKYLRIPLKALTFLFVLFDEENLHT